ncbi:hypothetical protein GTQ34_11115 [Muricauda sp. JGD-17]|uniref:Uncharacterized protein n=1 Tax=Flagellimonas ochracea TaxID=2696472 RepID=A0A964WXS9_9FLAO|nr:hypothetical protein [Allomuricauda ochracea]
MDEAAVDAFVANNGYLTAEVDGDASNEIQDLDLNTNTLSLSGDPTTVDLSPYLDDTTLDEAAVDAFVANNGYLTAEVDGDASNEIQNISAGTGITVTPSGQDFTVAVTNSVIAMGKINLDGTSTNITGATVIRNGVGSGNYTVTFNVGVTTDANYIVQLTLLGAGPEATIEILNVPATGSFDVQISQLSVGAGPSLTSSPLDAQWYFTVTDF